jgi:serine/threonine-protein kinase
MYEMLTGKVPFDADTPVSVALMHMQEDAKQPIEINKDIPIAVNSIVMKAMRKEPLERYQTATEMLADLSEALKDPNGDFVVIENKDGEYTRVMPAIKIDRDNSKRTIKKEGFFDKHPKLKIPAFVLGLIILFILVFGVTKLILDGGFKKVVNAPDFSNMTQAEVEKLASSQKVTVKFSEVASADVEVGKVVSQEPPAGEALGEDLTVEVFISKGPETTDLPDFVNKPIDEVTSQANEIGLKLEITRENSDTIQENYVISQDIKAGTKVKSGDKLKIVVSDGVKKTKVPMVIGMDEGTAIATLSNSHLAYKVIYENMEDDPDTNGKVVGQSIEKDKEVAENTVVEIRINKIIVVKHTVTIKYVYKLSSADDIETVKPTVQFLASNTKITTTEKSRDKEKKTITYEATYTGSDAVTFTVEVAGREVAKRDVTKQDLIDYDNETITIE